MNEETIIENTPILNESFEQNANNAKKGNAWVNVTLGGVSGILMGAGLMYGGSKIYGKSQEEKLEEMSGEEPPIQVYPPKDESQPITEETTNSIQTNIGKDQQQATETNTSTSAPEVHHVIDVLHVADVKDNQSFGEAFAAARAEVGPGGVFTWHGGVYNTYTVEEWNAMSPKEQADFASVVHVSKPVYEIQDLPTDDNPTIVYVENLHVHTDVNDGGGENKNESSVDGDDDGIHVIGVGETEDGHSIYAVDDDYEMDVAIIDVDDSNDLSNPDRIIHSTTVAELNGDGNVIVALNEEPEGQLVYEENDDDIDEYSDDISDDTSGDYADSYDNFGDDTDSTI